MTAWVLFCKRTEDPKLAWIEQELDARGIPHRRNGHSWHAPILEVPEAYETAAWTFLGSTLTPRHRRTIDEMPDDHRLFADARSPGDSDDGQEPGPDPIRDGWVGKDGRP